MDRKFVIFCHLYMLPTYLMFLCRFGLDLIPCLCSRERGISTPADLAAACSTGYFEGKVTKKSFGAAYANRVCSTTCCSINIQCGWWGHTPSVLAKHCVCVCVWGGGAVWRGVGQQPNSNPGNRMWGLVKKGSSVPFHSGFLRCSREQS